MGRSPPRNPNWRHTHWRSDVIGGSHSFASGSDKAVRRYACAAHRRHTYWTLVLAADPAAPLQAATKGYVDTQVGGALPKAGGTLTGVLTLAADPTLSMQAATKHYVDAQAAVSLPISGGTLTGPLSLPSSPTQPLQAAPKQYVDGQVSSALPIAGGTLTGALTLVGIPHRSCRPQPSATWISRAAATPAS